MRRVCFASYFVFTFALMVFTGVAAGRNPFRRNFFAVYPSARGTVLDTVPSSPGHCGTCHYDFSGGGPRNPYGLAVEAAGTSEAAIAALGAADSDGDGFSNSDEITDTTAYNNTPTFPGLTPANLGLVSKVAIADIQNYLVPRVGTDTTPPVVVVVHPDGGEAVVGNAPTTVQWTATDEGGVASVDIHLSLDGGLTFSPIIEGLANTGSYTWFAANRPTSDAIVRVVAVDNSMNRAHDDSNAVFSIVSPPGGAVPTTLRDFDMPGTQPLEALPLSDPLDCAVCHGNYDSAAEPFFNWKGSMMAMASRDILFQANMVIANQDAPDSGDMCLRCHLPRGWLGGRSVPTDGKAMLPADEKGVSCDLCHRMVDPIYKPGVSPDRDADILADLLNPPAVAGNGMYVVDPIGSRRGPFEDADSAHAVVVSPFHREAAICGTCHDVSNPAFEKNAEGEYMPNAFDSPAADFAPSKLLAVERTYSEWLHSDYNTPTGVFAPQFGGNKGYVATCQDCHMRDISGKGCNPDMFPAVPLRHDLPLHDMTGGSTWMPGLLAAMYPDEVDASAAAAGAERARYMLQNAAELSYVIRGGELKVKVTNNTGHKLPTGYPEGRRIWLNVKFFNRSGGLVAESGAYDPDTGVLSQDADVKVYEVKPGLDSVTAPLAGESVGPSFHFVLNNTVFKDNRIPPRGFTNAAFEEFGGAPVAHSYADGQYWDETAYTIPAGAASAAVTLYYQSTSKEFIEFLRDKNTTNDLGQQLYQLWADNGKCPPEIMAAANVPITDLTGGGVDMADFAVIASRWLVDCGLQSCDGANLDDSDNVINMSDLAIFVESWLWGK